MKLIKNAFPSVQPQLKPFLQRGFSLWYWPHSFLLFPSFSFKKVLFESKGWARSVSPLALKHVILGYTNKLDPTKAFEFCKLHNSEMSLHPVHIWHMLKLKRMKCACFKASVKHLSHCEPRLFLHCDLY